jgi:hypothetical protein
MKKLLLLASLLVSCGTTLKNSNWTPEQVKSLGIIENCTPGKEKQCQCVVDKIQEKFPDYTEANIKLLDQKNRLEAAQVIFEITKQCMN